MSKCDSPRGYRCLNLSTLRERYSSGKCSRTRLRCNILQKRAGCISGCRTGRTCPLRYHDASHETNSKKDDGLIECRSLLEHLLHVLNMWYTPLANRLFERRSTSEHKLVEWCSSSEHTAHSSRTGYIPSTNRLIKWYSKSEHGWKCWSHLIHSNYREVRWMMQHNRTCTACSPPLIRPIYG